MSCTTECWGHLLSDSGVVHLSQHRITIGRASSSDVVVDDVTEDRMVSSQHAVILRIGACAMILDTSLNGTYLNGRRVVKSLLSPNDTIRLGKRRSMTGQFSRYQFVYITKQPPPRLSLPLMDEKHTEDLRSALQCRLCSEFLVFPTEVMPCSHLFCSACVEAFMLRSSSGTCPQCETAISSFKARTKFNFSGIIEKALKLILSDREYSAYANRMAHRKQELLQRQKALSVLRDKQESVQYNPESGDPFLLICQAWTSYEKSKFLKGISRYTYGEAREYYCWMVRLTEDWVLRDANKTDISVALNNLGLLTSVEEYSIDQARDALVRFIYGKQQALP